MQLRAHHVARLIEYQDDPEGIRIPLEFQGYSPETIDAAITIFKGLLADRSQIIQIAEEDVVGEDAICAICDRNQDGECQLTQGKPIQAHTSADLRQGLRFSLNPGEAYAVAQILAKKPAFNRKFRI